MKRIRDIAKLVLTKGDILDRDILDVFKRADKALYEAKNSGKNRTIIK